MELFVYNTELELLGICDSASSLVWRRRFFSAGAFTLQAPASPENLRLLKKHHMIEKAGGEVGYITAVTLESGERGEIITVSGSIFTGVLANRIIVEPHGDFLTLIDKNIGTGARAERRIPKLFIDKSCALPSEYHEGLDFENLAAYAEAVCRKNGVGLTARIEHGGGRRLSMRLAEGTDRSIEQSVNPRVIFSEDFDSLRGAKYQYSEKGAATTVYGYAKIDGRTEYDGEPIIRITGEDSAGFDRLEAARGVKAVTYKEKRTVFQGFGPNGAAIFKEQTFILVHVPNTEAAIDGAIAGAVILPAENFSGDVRFEDGYGKDYDLGDIVTVWQSKWNMTVSSRICEVAEYYENGGVFVEPVFGSPVPTFADILKRKD